jgi:hypothetical protein
MGMQVEVIGREVGGRATGGTGSLSGLQRRLDDPRDA